MMVANYHMHTRWCRHASGEIEDYIKKSILYGLKEIAITEHVPFENDFDDNRMQWEEFPLYNEELDGLVQQYKNEINIIKGFECEYFPNVMKKYEVFNNKYGYDFFILGQHRSGTNAEYDNFAIEDDEGIKRYAKDVCMGINTGFFSYLAHPDIFVEKFKDSAFSKTIIKALDDIFEACEKNNVIVEINANGLRNKRNYTRSETYKYSKNFKLNYAVGCDAHSPEAINDKYVLQALKIAEDLELKVDLNYKGGISKFI